MKFDNLHKWLARAFRALRSRRTPIQRPTRGRFRPSLESLEDRVTPSVTASIAATTPVGLTTNASSVTYTITFSAATTGLTASNLSLSGTAGIPATDLGTPTTADSGVDWTETISNLATNGTLTLNLANATGLSNTVTTTLPLAGPTYTLNYTAPTTSISAPTQMLVAGHLHIAYTVTYASTDFASSNLGTGNITLNTTGTASATVTVSPGSGPTRTVTLINITGSGTLGITIAAGTAVDQAGNLATAPTGPSATVTVGPPVFTTAASAFFTAGSAGSFHVAATTGASSPMTYSLVGAPSWLHINTLTGALSGTPPLTTSSLVQTFTFTIDASSGVMPDATQKFTLSALQPRRRGAA